MRNTLPIALALLVAGLTLPAAARAQSDDNSIPLGDVARKVRQAKAAQQPPPPTQPLPPPAAPQTVVITPPEETAPSLGEVARELRRERPAPQTVVIDNDNLPQVMQEAESHRQSNSLLYKFEKAAKMFQVSFSPDMNCSLSFNANATPVLNSAYVAESLPESELEKLDGPAAVDGDSLQINVYNGSNWSLREITVGVTIVRKPPTAPGIIGPPQLLPAVTTMQPLVAQAEKKQDFTVLYHIKGTAAPSSTTLFKAILDAPIGPDEEWHWSIVDAKGVLVPTPAQASAGN
jgi:hypothetical protein